jgi:hypothetical protein
MGQKMRWQTHVCLSGLLRWSTGRLISSISLLNFENHCILPIFAVPLRGSETRSKLNLERGENFLHSLFIQLSIAWNPRGRHAHVSQFLGHLISLAQGQIEQSDDFR